MPGLSFPFRHVSIRVPWHDAAWNGRVCSAPHLNAECSKLKGIAQQKREDAERAIAGESLEELSHEQWPPCVAERATFMAPFELEHIKRHALAKVNPKFYGHFRDTRQRYPAYSAGIVPFRWMMRANMADYADRFELDVDAAREPDLGYESRWVHERENQTSLLDGFRRHLREDQSLCFFYAKHVPFVEGTGRILIGAGRVKRMGQLTEYKREGDGMRGMVWERPLQHSIRPLGTDGFLLPYHEILRRTGDDPSLNAERYACKAPEGHWDEFSYGSELVTHDGAIGSLLSLEAMLDRAESDLGIEASSQRAWIHDELVRLWKVRGPFPGLGAVLTAFGLSRGVFVAHALQEKAGVNADPWPLVDAAFRDPAKTLPAELRRDLKELAPTWKKITAERRAFLRLLSRFELTSEQASALYEEGSRRKHRFDASDAEILANPYRLAEICRHDPEGVPLIAVDRGVFPDDVVRLTHPLEAPSRLESAIDLRRVRAFTIATLEDAARNGHTVVPADRIVTAIVEQPIRPGCPVTGDILSAHATDMAPEVSAIDGQDGPNLQLTRYATIGELVRKQVEGRIKGKRSLLEKDWRRLLARKFGPAESDEEKKAQAEKAAALAELTASRITVFAGAAGTGKTSVLSIFCSQPEIRDKGILMLAPTGKARVRMQELAGRANATAQTVAQFLNANGRYDVRSGQYHLSDRPKVTGFGTVIVDESSMLTEDMIGAVFDALQGVDRFILVGDPSQLPPIGAGRPFVDIIGRLRPPDYESRVPRVASGYAELTIERRQVGEDRPDLRLARWFGTASAGPADDDIFFCDPREHSSLHFVEWRDAEDFQQKLIDVLVEQLALDSDLDVRGFNRSLGATATDEYDYFNRSSEEKAGAVGHIEDWQILSPLRGLPFGVTSINRQIHERFRRAFLELASRQRRSIPKPFGDERVVYGDKLINLSNHRRDGQRVYPKDGALGYLANGEIGIAVGLWKSWANPKILKVEFSSQPGYTYDFYGSDFREEGAATLELAYALTVHKAQGSQFKIVILVLPEEHPILSRELVYTALTRHQDRVVVMHQGSRSRLKEFAAPHRSDTAKRMTNLMRPSRMLEVRLAKGSVFLQEGLVHRTTQGLAVRSKSELIIAEALGHAGIAFEFEKPLSLSGETRYPDFTIEDEISGATTFWEHLGMLDRPDYRRRWEKKLSWYKANGILPVDDGGGPNGSLITTIESTKAGFDAGTIAQLIRRHLS